MAIYSRLVRDLFLPLALWRNGELAQLRHLREFERTQFLPEEQLRELQWARLRSLLAHAAAHCPLYRQRFCRAGLTPMGIRSFADLRALPPLEKREIQEHAADMVASNWPRHDVLPNQTGGSTGTPIAFYL